MDGILESLLSLWPILLAYVVGATPFGFLAGKLNGIDIRDHGSGNIGATNVLRTLGKPVGITVLVLDILKGMAPVVVARLVSDSSPLLIATAVAAILGHNYTFWLRFKGGKGIATTAGAMAPVMPLALGVAVAVWLLLLLTTRYVSVSSIGAAISIPSTLIAASLVSDRWDGYVLGFGIFVCVLAVWKHRSNIARLRRGEENRFGTKKPTTSNNQ